MMHYRVTIERDGTPATVGMLYGNQDGTARFQYLDSYRNNAAARPISISLPLQEEVFPEDTTHAFFDGLLPEGFPRRVLAENIHAHESDYVKLLGFLGSECIGAIRVEPEEMHSPGYEKDGYEPLSMNQVRALAKEGASKSVELLMRTHLSLAGATGKVGLYWNAADQMWYLPHGLAPSTHILKQSHVRLSHIVWNEQLALRTAKKLGLNVVESTILNTGGGLDEEILLVTKRYDRTMERSIRTVNGLPCPLRIHQEDFAQALRIPASRKYERAGDEYLKKQVNLLKANAVNPLAAIEEFWKRTVYNILIGNTDAHLKNTTLLYDSNLESIRLAPAYDLLSTTVYEESTRNMACAVAGVQEIDRIRANTLIEAAKEVGIGEKMANRILFDLCNSFEEALSSSAYELKEEGFRDAISLKNRILKTGGARNLDR